MACGGSKWCLQPRRMLTCRVAAYQRWLPDWEEGICPLTLPKIMLMAQFPYVSVVCDWLIAYYSDSSPSSNVRIPNVDRIFELKLRHCAKKPEGRGFDSRWGHWVFYGPNPSGRIMAVGSS